MDSKERKRILDNNYRLGLIYNKYKMLSLNMFRWEGLPQTIESRHIENSLFNYGLCLIVNDDDLGFISVPCNYGAYMNVNNVPTEVITCGFNYINNRKFYNFVKTNSCNIATAKVPLIHLEEIKEIFNRGVTIWHIDNGAEPLNYNVNNMEV